MNIIERHEPQRQQLATEYIGKTAYYKDKPLGDINDVTCVNFGNPDACWFIFHVQVGTNSQGIRDLHTANTPWSIK